MVRGAALAQPPTARPSAGEATFRISIEDAIRAIDHTSNPIGVARANAQRARADVTSARSRYLPQITATGSYVRTLRSEFDDLFPTEPSTGDPGATFGGFEALPFGRDHIWNAGVEGSQLIFDGGRTSSTIAIARGSERVARLEVKQTRAQAVLDVTEAYFNAVYAARVVAINEASLALAEQTLAQTRQGFEQGVTAEFDALRAEVTRDEQQTALVRARADRDEAFLRLYQLLAIPFDRRVELTTPLYARDVGAVAEVARTAAGVPREAERIGITQARNNVEIRRAQLGLARGGRWPSITAVTDYGVVDYPDRFWPDTDWRTNWTIGVNVVVPIFTGFRTTAEIRRARADVRAAQYQYAEAQGQAAVDSRRARLDSEVARSTLASTQRSATLARRAYEIADVRYRQGVSTYLELVDARISFDRAQMNEAGATRDLAVSTVRLALLPALPVGVPVIAQTTGIGVVVTPEITPAISPLTPRGPASPFVPTVTNPAGAPVQLQ